jgi:hypothetical protein
MINPIEWSENKHSAFKELIPKTEILIWNMIWGKLLIAVLTQIKPTINLATAKEVSKC